MHAEINAETCVHKGIDRHPLTCERGNNELKFTSRNGELG